MILIKILILFVYLFFLSQLNTFFNCETKQTNPFQTTNLYAKPSQPQLLPRFSLCILISKHKACTKFSIYFPSKWWLSPCSISLSFLLQLNAFLPHSKSLLSSPSLSFSYASLCNFFNFTCLSCQQQINLDQPNVTFLFVLTADYVTVPLHLLLHLTWLLFVNYTSPSPLRVAFSSLLYLYALSYGRLSVSLCSLAFLWVLHICINMHKPLS